MYTPKQFEQNDLRAAHTVLEQNPFAIVCTADDEGGVDVVHVPTMLVSDGSENGAVHFHVAKQNPIWKLFNGTRKALAVFSGPHAYISPDWYEADGLVPTWNYVAVHVTGTPTVVPEAQNADHLAALAAQEEGHLSPKTPWTPERMDPDLHARMIKGIVGVVLPIEKIQAKAKLSQNRGPEDKVGVIAGLRERGGDTNTAVADLMQADL